MSNCGRWPHAVFGQGTPAAAAWVEPLKDRLYTEGVAPVLAALDALAPPDAAAADIVRTARENFFGDNVARMDYPAFVARQFPIGSGAIESTCKTLIEAREKQAGMRWSARGAQAVASLRALHRSGGWTAFWQTHPQRRCLPGPSQRACPPGAAARAAPARAPPRPGGRRCPRPLSRPAAGRVSVGRAPPHHRTGTAPPTIPSGARSSLAPPARLPPALGLRDPAQLSAAAAPAGRVSIGRAPPHHRPHSPADHRVRHPIIPGAACPPAARARPERACTIVRCTPC